MATTLAVDHARTTALPWLLALAVSTLSALAPASAQYACTANYCVSSQSTSFQTPTG
jgi:hypothetical protein